MKTIMNKVALSTYIACLICILSCKKDNGMDNANNGNSDIPQIIANALNSNDSLQQFSRLFKLISISNTEVDGGVTVLALTDNALINPSDPESLKDYVLKGTVIPNEPTKGKSMTSITGQQIDITFQNGRIFANGSMISSEPVATSSNYTIYALSGLYNTGYTNGYDDPHKNEYYIEYYQNGTHLTLNGRKITSWQFFTSTGFPTPVSGNCSFPTYHSYSSGPAQALQAFAYENPFCLQINRSNFSAPPITGDYRMSVGTYNQSQNTNTGNCNLIINGAVFGCNFEDDDSYVHVKITEVKIDQDLGLEKRGYYKGEFDAILYYTSYQGGVPEKRIITGGRFMAPMGGGETSALNGTAPIIDRTALLSNGKWFWRPTVLMHLNDPDSQFDLCNIDDYIVFRANGTCDWIDGGVQCGIHEGEFDYGNNIGWYFKNDQTIVHFDEYDVDWPIVELSDSLLVFSNGFKLAHGN